MKQRYGILFSISSQSDLGPELLTESEKVVDFSSIDAAVKRAEEHSKLLLVIKDWIYDIVPLEEGHYGKPIESYHSIPKFEKIFPKN